ncbi:Hypothetical predicted protein, partial [Mytilus galloprovincialis]
LLITETDNYSLILGLAVGIPMAFLLLMFTILLCICCNRHKQQKQKTKYTEEVIDRPTAIDERFFANNVATRFDSFGENICKPSEDIGIMDLLSPTKIMIEHHILAKSQIFLVKVKILKMVTNKKD